MLSASSARRWSSRGITARSESSTAELLVISGAQKQKAREDVPGFDLSSVFLGLFGVYPNSWTETAETSMVWMQQHAHVRQAPGTTVRTTYQGPAGRATSVQSTSPVAAPAIGADAPLATSPAVVSTRTTPTRVNRDNFDMVISLPSRVPCSEPTLLTAVEHGSGDLS